MAYIPTRAASSSSINTPPRVGDPGPVPPPAPRRARITSDIPSQAGGRGWSSQVSDLDQGASERKRALIRRLSGSCPSEIDPDSDMIRAALRLNVIAYVRFGN
jgi:hypothetical protein